MAVALTSLSHGAGCGCKLPAAALRPIVAGSAAPGRPARARRRRHAPTTPASSQLTDDTRDRADRRTSSRRSSTTRTAFGRIAATNALSDVYAMGGRAGSALNLVAFPLETLGPDVLREILRGGADAAAGGGRVDRRRPLDRRPGAEVRAGGDGRRRPARGADQRRRPRRRRARADQAAGRRARSRRRCKRGLAAAELRRARDRGDDARSTTCAAEQARAAGAHALTDVTGFGLLGHVHELAAASGLAAEIDAAAIPAIDGVLELLADERARRRRLAAQPRRRGELHDVRRRACRSRCGGWRATR